jgi:riboflavin biosynthesis pyrimidine reductase
MSVFIEAGGVLNGSFLPYADKLYHFSAPKILSDNKGKTCFDGYNMTKISQCFQLNHEKTEIYPPDILNIYSINH